MRPSHQELKDLWLYSYSRGSLLEADQWLNVMDQTDLESPQTSALVCATVVAYARPFTISQVTGKERVVPLKGVSPPSHLSASHEMVLKLRDKVIGHKDATVAKGDTATPNIILVNRDATGFDIHTIIVRGMAPNIRKELKSLCSHFVAYCEAQIRPLFTRYGQEIMRHPIGVYELLVTEGPDDWIQPHKLVERSTEQS